MHSVAEPWTTSPRTGWQSDRRSFWWATADHRRGNSDIGLAAYLSNDGTYAKNTVFEEGLDHVNSGYDYGIGNWGDNNIFTKNKVMGFDVPYDPEELDGQYKNKALPVG